MDLVRRNEWNARAPSGPLSAMPSGVKGCKIHYTGGHVDPGLLTDHAKCVSAVHGIQAGHMDGNGWIDIGYSFAVCPHRKVFEGRGLRHLPSANGAGLNSSHYAILGLVGNSGLVIPPMGMVEGIRDAIAYVREHGPCGNEIKGHRDGYSTDCPGEPLYDLVENGFLIPTSTRVESDMPGYVSVGLDEKKPLTLNPEAWLTLQFDSEAADPDGMHANGRFPSFLTGKARFVATISATLSGLDKGTEGQIRLYEVDSENKVTKSNPIQEWEASQGDTFIHHTVAGTVDEGMKLRAKIVQFGEKPVSIKAASAKVLYWA